MKIESERETEGLKTDIQKTQADREKQAETDRQRQTVSQIERQANREKETVRHRVIERGTQ